MTAPASTESSWHARDRSFDWGAAFAFAAAGTLSFVTRGGLDALSLALAAAGIALIFVDRERWLEKRGHELRIAERTWLFGPHAERVRDVVPERVVLAPAGRGLVLSIEARGQSIEIERWSEPSEELFGRSCARRLARWLDLPLFESTSSATWRADRQLDASELRSSLRTLPNEPAVRPGGVFRGHALRARLMGLVQALVGGGLLVYAARGGGHATLDWLALASLPLGALLAVEGLRSALPGAVVTRIDAGALHVEREGIARELIAHVAFAEVRRITYPHAKRFRSHAVRIDLGGDALWLQPAELGLGVPEFERFASSLRETASAWIRAHAPAASDTLVLSEPLPDAASSMEPWDARSGLALLGARFPRLGLATAFGFVALAFLLQRTLTTTLDDAPKWVCLETTSVAGYASWAAVAIAGAALVLAPLLAAYRIVRASPELPWMGLLVLLLWVPGTVPIVSALVSAQDIGQSANICLGETTRRFTGELIEDGDAMRFTDPSGDVEVYRALVRRGTVYRSGIAHLSRSPEDLVEIDGRFGGRYVVVSGELPQACALWRAVR